jgi:hypothetical protein
MKRQILFTCILSAFIGSVFFSSCNKEDKKNNDLTSEVVGRYTNPNDYNLEIIVNKINNSTVSITVQNSHHSDAFTNVTMNSANAFTLNSFKGVGWCSEPFQSDEFLNSFYEAATVTTSGTGTASNNNISLFINKQIVADSGSCTNNFTYTFSASK